MESKREWFEMAVALLPAELAPFVDLRYSERAEYCHSIFRGVGYAEVPERRYEFVFVDGPSTMGFDGTRAFDFDILNVIKRADWPVRGLVDQRIGTMYVLEKILGHCVTYDALRLLGIVGPCTAADIGSEIGAAVIRRRGDRLELDQLRQFDQRPPA